MSGTDNGPSVTFDGGPRSGQDDILDDAPPVIGTGEEGGIYQRTERRRNGLTVYEWHALTEAEVKALVRGDLRANQEPHQSSVAQRK